MPKNIRGVDTRMVTFLKTFKTWRTTVHNCFVPKSSSKSKAYRRWDATATFRWHLAHRLHNAKDVFSIERGCLSSFSCFLIWVSPWLLGCQVTIYELHVVLLVFRTLLGFSLGRDLRFCIRLYMRTKMAKGRIAFGSRYTVFKSWAAAFQSCSKFKYVYQTKLIPVESLNIGYTDVFSDSCMLLNKNGTKPNSIWQSNPSEKGCGGNTAKFASKPVEDTSQVFALCDSTNLLHTPTPTYLRSSRSWRRQPTCARWRRRQQYRGNCSSEALNRWSPHRHRCR